MNRQIVQLADGIGQKIVLIGVEKPEGSSKTLRNFMQKHPYNRLQTAALLRFRASNVLRTAGLYILRFRAIVTRGSCFKS